MKPRAVEKSVVVVAARLSVMQVHVEPAQVWFHCPRCSAQLEGFMSDPRGQRDIVCEACAQEFDIPAAADIVIS